MFVLSASVSKSFKRKVRRGGAEFAEFFKSLRLRAFVANIFATKILKHKIPQNLCALSAFASLISLVSLIFVLRLPQISADFHRLLKPSRPHTATKTLKLQNLCAFVAIFCT